VFIYNITHARTHTHVYCFSNVKQINFLSEILMNEIVILQFYNRTIQRIEKKQEF